MTPQEEQTLCSELSTLRAEVDRHDRIRRAELLYSDSAINDWYDKVAEKRNRIIEIMQTLNPPQKKVLVLGSRGDSPELAEALEKIRKTFGGKTI